MQVLGGDGIQVGEDNMGWGSWEGLKELKGGDIPCSKDVGLRCSWLTVGEEMAPREHYSKARSIWCSMQTKNIFGIA